jgi:hypothetical protein
MLQPTKPVKIFSVIAMHLLKEFANCSETVGSRALRTVEFIAPDQFPVSLAACAGDQERRQ